MIEVQSVLVGNGVIDRCFICNLKECKGECCVAGDTGAPLAEWELPILEEIYPKIKPYLTDAGIFSIEEQGAYVKDGHFDFTTPLINDEECAYADYDDNGVLYCCIEKAFNDGEIDFQKPISCHLYPIRIKNRGPYDMLICDQWSICSEAFYLGDQKGVPVYEFLKEPLIRRYGQEWYDELIRKINREKK